MAPKKSHVPSSRGFPFERLPVELQRNVLQYALPDCLSWKQKKPGKSINSYSNLPRSLLRVSKHVSTLVRSIVTHEIPLRIVVLPIDVQIPATNTKQISHYGTPGRYLPHTALAGAKHLPQMRNFELEMDTCGDWDLLEDVNYPDLLCVRAPDIHILKEKVRLVCDALASSALDTRSLTVTFPCCCHLDDRMSRLAEDAIIEVFAPIRRLSVARKVTFCCEHTWVCEFGPEDDGRPQQIDLVKVERITSRLEATYGRLVGEELTSHERLWKEVKAMERPQHSPWKMKVRERIEKLFRTLNNYPGEFEVEALEAKEFIDMQTRKSKEELPLPKRR
ncbi:MAG: hypothetical protein Q9174_004743 [Haloplaca sp. 1 TL-2023]